MDSSDVFTVLLVLITVIALSARAYTGCSDGDAAALLLTQQGYTEIETTGWEAFACGKGDYTATGFHAVSPAGAQVDGVVCCGLMKRCTVRF